MSCLYELPFHRIKLKPLDSRVPFYFRTMAWVMEFFCQGRGTTTTLLRSTCTYYLHCPSRDMTQSSIKIAQVHVLDKYRTRFHATRIVLLARPASNNSCLHRRFRRVLVPLKLLSLQRASSCRIQKCSRTTARSRGIIEGRN